MKRKTFPLRINPRILAAMQRWANDDLRSVNAQIEYVLRESLVKAGRYSEKPIDDAAQNGEEEEVNQ